MVRDFSPLATRIIPCSMYSSRNGVAIDHILDHHQAGTDSEAVALAMQNATRATSANYIVTNEGEIWGVIPETLRAWTSGSTSDGGKGAAWDRRSITAEVENDINGEPWTRSVAASEACSALYQDVADHYGFHLSFGGSNDSVLRHRDLWDYFKASYPTRCDGTVDLAAIVVGKPSMKGTDMQFVTTKTSAGVVTGHLFGEFCYESYAQGTPQYLAAARIFAKGLSVDAILVELADIPVMRTLTTIRREAFINEGGATGAPTAAQNAAATQTILADEFAAIPTAAQNGEAARLAIVK